MFDVTARSILSARNGMNIYRGCTHGCIYCDSRSTCYQVHPDRPFEDIEVKANAPELLETALRKKRKKCMIGTGAMCDPYLPLEKERRLTRRCLELIDTYGFGVSLLTKSDLILRDLDLLKRINAKTKCVVQMTLTTYDEDLCRVLEPQVCTTKRRFEVLKIMKEEGIPTICWMTPILPFINDTKENINGLLSLCRQASCYGIMLWGTGLTLRDGDRQYFYRKLDEHFPGLKERYQYQFGTAYELPSPNTPQLMSLIRSTCLETGMVCSPKALFTYLSTFEDKQAGEQLSLFH